MPVTGAAIAISIFIASRITSVSPSTTSWPALRKLSKHSQRHGRPPHGRLRAYPTRVPGHPPRENPRLLRQPSRQRPAFAFLVEGLLLADLEGGRLFGNVSQESPILSQTENLLLDVEFELAGRKLLPQPERARRRPPDRIESGQNAAAAKVRKNRRSCRQRFHIWIVRPTN